MTYDGLQVAIPDEMMFSMDDDSITYTESYEADSDGLAEDVAETTEELAMLYAKHLEDEDGDSINVDVDTWTDGKYVNVEVVIQPGKPEGAENIGLAAIAGEIMATLAVADPLMWNTVVKATEGSAEDMFEELARMMKSRD